MKNSFPLNTNTRKGLNSEYSGFRWISFATKILCLLLLSLAFFVSSSARADIVISQVYEGTSNNKYVEISNTGASAVDLASPQLKLAIWGISGSAGNGSVSGNVTSANLAGTIPAGGSVVFKHSLASAPAYIASAAVANASVNFNGNDAIAIVDASNVVLDAFGAGISNLDKNYTRNALSTTASATFNVADWASGSYTVADNAAADTNDRLGYFPAAASTVPSISGISPAAALDGASVTITGTNLASPTSVAFTTANGTANATLTSNSTTQIVCTVPVGTVTGNVTVTTANGSASASFRSLNPIAIPYGPEAFESTQGAAFSYSVAGSNNWARVTSTLGSGVTNAPSNGSMQMNGYGSDVNANDWLVLGPFDMTGVTNPGIEFNALTQFAFAPYSAGTGEMALKVSTNYPGVGDPSSSTWTSLSFQKPTTDLNKTPSGQVALAGAAGQSSVYIAFHYTAGGTLANSTALWQIDDVELYDMTLPSLSVIAPGSLTEGAAAQVASVSIPTVLGTDLTVTLTSADAGELLVDGDGLGFAATSTVVIYAGLTSAEFLVQPVADGVVDGNQSVQISANAAGYDFGQAMVQVVDVNYAAPSVVINKVINNGSPDIVELLVVGNGTVGSTVDLQGMILKDYSASAGTDGGGSFTFATSPTWASVAAGTLIVLTNQMTGTEDLDGTDFVMRANLGNAGLFTPAVGFDVGNTELVQIKAAGSGAAGATGAIHSVGFGSISAAQIVAAPMPKLVSATSGSFQVVTNTSGTLADFNGSGLTTLGAAPTTGIPSNAGNADFISSLRGVEIVSVSIAGASAIINENAGEQTDAITISLSTPAASDLTVNLSALPSSTITLPASVIIGTGLSSATVSFTPVDDAIPAGNRDVTITATASGYQSGSNSLTVVDTQFVAPSVVINEVSNGGTGGTDSVELLTISNGLNMVGMVLKDFSGNMGGDGGGKYTFADVPLWQSVPAGTLIVLTTDAAATEDTDASDAVVTLKLSNATYFTGSGSFDISSIDMVMIKAAGSGTSGVAGAIHTFGVGAAGSYFTQAGGAKLLGSGTTVAAENATSALADFNGTGAVSQASTLAAANNSTNQVFIDSLRSSASPIITSALTLNGTVGTAITPYQITASGAPTSYGSGVLPAGLTLNGTTGIISGTPGAIAAGSVVEISATNGAGTGSANLTISIGQGTPSIVSAPTASDIAVGSALSVSILSGGSASVPGTFAWTSPATVPPLGTALYGVTFTPADSVNYTTTLLNVSLNVVSGNYEFADWSGGAPLTNELLVKFAIGGATGPGAVSEVPVVAVEGADLTLTAIVRTNNNNLLITAEATNNLAGTWSNAGVTSTTVGVSQTGVISGTERRKFLVPMGVDTKKFLRLRAVLAP